MMAGSLLVGASWTPTPRERALLAKVGAARLYSSLVSWILGFVQFVTSCPLEVALGRNSYKFFWDIPRPRALSG